MRQLRDKLIPILLGFALTGLSLWALTTETTPIRPLVQRLEYLVYDVRLNVSLPPRVPDSRVVIIDIDEKSLAAEGQWPWPRAKLAALLDRLWEAGVPVVAFDVLFAEPEENSAEEVHAALRAGGAPGELLKQVEDLRGRFDGDARLADALARGDSILGYVFHPDTDVEPAAPLPPAPLVLEEERAERMILIEKANHAANLPQLQAAATSAGFFSTEPDRDGVIRRSPLVMRYGRNVYPALALETVRVLYFLEGFDLQTATVGGTEVMEGVRLGQALIPTDQRGQVIVPYRGPQGSFPYISATDVLHGRVPQARLDGAVALIGTSAQGLLDLRATPLASTYPGVEVHANIIAALMNAMEAASFGAPEDAVQFPQRPDWADGAAFLLILALGVILALAFPFLSPLGLALVGTSGSAAMVSTNFWLWSEHGLVMPLAVPLLLIIGLATLNMGHGYLFENRRKELLKNRFGEYVPPQLVEEMSQNPEDYGFEGDNRVMTVLFADIRSFTAISESLEANELKDLLNRFFTPMTRIIFEQRGTIDKYVGDMIMAFWGAPVDDPEHRRHAVQAALQMLREVKIIREQFVAEGLPAIDIGIGLNTGPMNVGDMGSEYRRAYTVLGDAVNLGSRLEGLTKYYGVNLVVSDATREGLEAEFLFRELDLVKVKGKHQAVAVFEPVCPLADAGADLLREVEQHHEALRLYRSRHWAQARAAFQALRQDHPQTRIYQLYMERILELEDQDLDEDWDGVFVRTEK